VGTHTADSEDIHVKTIILLGDGMADEPVGELGGKTPLEVAHIPVMDSLASRGELGMARTVKKGFPPEAMWRTWQCSVSIRVRVIQAGRRSRP
jgi:hypothetical protein